MSTFTKLIKRYSKTYTASSPTTTTTNYDFFVDEIKYKDYLHTCLAFSIIPLPKNLYFDIDNSSFVVYETVKHHNNNITHYESLLKGLVHHDNVLTIYDESVTYAKCKMDVELIIALETFNYIIKPTGQVSPTGEHNIDANVTHQITIDNIVDIRMRTILLIDTIYYEVVHITADSMRATIYVSQLGDEI